MKISGSQPLKWDGPWRRTGRIVSDLHGRLSPRLNNSWLLSLHPPLHPLSLLSFSCSLLPHPFSRPTFPSLLSPFAPLASLSPIFCPFLLSLLSPLPPVLFFIHPLPFPIPVFSLLSSHFLSLFSASFLPFLASTLAPSREMEEEERERDKREREGARERERERE
jgi:hypothetical protein